MNASGKESFNIDSISSRQPFFVIFFGGLAWHLSAALIAHLVSYNSRSRQCNVALAPELTGIPVVQWSTTIKEVQVSNFFKEVPAIFKRFWMMLVVCFTVIGVIIVMTTSIIPVGYQIRAFNAIVPVAVVMGCHILLPVALNRESSARRNMIRATADIVLLPVQAWLMHFREWPCYPHVHTMSTDLVRPAIHRVLKSMVISVSGTS